MSDPTPDDLYEALRKRLADYGQEPPPDLWAGIRQQLPPPVAVPRRRRWRAGLVLLLLVCVVASLATWQRQQAGSVAEKSGTVAQHNSASESPVSVSRNRDNEQAAPIASVPGIAPVGPALGNTTPAEQSVSNAASTGTASNTKTQPATLAYKLSNPGLARIQSIVNHQTNNTLNQGAAAKLVMPAVPMEAAGRSIARRKGAPVLASTELNASETRRRLRATLGTRYGQPATALARQTNKSASDAARTARLTAAARRPQATANAAGSSATAVAQETDGAVAAATGTISASRRAAAGTAAQPAGGPPAASGLAQSLAEAPADATQPGAWDWLALRVAGLQVPAAAALRAPQPVEVAPLPPLLPTVVSRWAVQLVAGPSLTYRHLGTASGLSYATNSLATPAMAAPIFSNGSINSIQTTSSAASLERPALGYGAQLSIRRTLTPHWTVSAGLGYAEYATALALLQVNATQITRANYDFAFLDSLSRASGTTIRQRDTYRFLTVPLRAGYVWNTGARWQVGLLGGFDAAIYLGGTSTEGSACACQPQTWGASGSPYRSLSLAASLGAEVRYRLAGPWQLLAQPTASYLLSPLAKPTSGYSIRHLLGGTALLGMSYDLP